MFMNKTFSLVSCLLTFVLGFHFSHAQQKRAPLNEKIPLGGKLEPKQEVPVFAVSSKQGMRVLVSWDDGKHWKQTFLATDHLEDGGWHGNYAVYGMAYTEGVIGVFSGWGAPGIYIGSDDGVTWSHLNSAEANLGSVWGATGGKGVMLTSADQWRGITSSGKGHAEWSKHSLKDLLNGGKTHHIISGYGDYKGGRFLAIGDNRHVFYSDDLCKTWKHSMLPDEVGDRGQDVIAYGNGIFLCSCDVGVARSADGGETWTLHKTGLPARKSWRSLSFVNGEFWMTTRLGKQAIRSKDGITWKPLPKGTPGGRFVQSETGAIINVERGRYEIFRSTDGLKWETVFIPPAKDVSWDTAFAVYGKVNAAK